MHPRKLCCFLLSVFFLCQGRAQTAELTQLRRQLTLATDSSQYLELYNKIGFLLHMQHADSVLRYGIEARVMAQRLNNRPQEAIALNNMASGLLLKGIYTEALPLYLESYHIFSSLHSVRDMMLELTNAAVCYDFIDDRTHATQFIRKALDLGRPTPEDSCMSTIYANYVILADLPEDSVNHYLDKAQRIAEHFHDQRSALVVQQTRILQHLEKKENLQAIALIRTFLQVARSNNWDYYELEGLDLQATYLRNTGHADSAIQVYRTMLNLAEASRFSYWQTDVLRKLQECYAQQKNVAGEVQVARQLTKALEQELEEAKSFTGDYLHTLSLEQEKKQAETAAASERNKVRLLLLAGTLCLAAVLVLFRLNRKNRRINRQLNGLYTQIQEQNKRLLGAVDFKGRLVSILAHDFRSPLNNLLSMTWLMRQEELSEAERGIFCDAIEKEINQVLALFDQVLGWVKLQSEGYVITWKKVLLHKTVNEAVQVLRQELEAKSIRLVNEVPPQVETTADEEIIRFVHRNLLHNAIKYSPDGGTIRITSIVTRTQVEISFTDEGPGIDAAVAAHLFSGYKQQGALPGAGIALVICRELLEKLNGSISAANRPDGRGAVFTYRLPVQG
jgi:signal transduction histidine kinase